MTSPAYTPRFNWDSLSELNRERIRTAFSQGLINPQIPQAFSSAPPETLMINPTVPSIFEQMLVGAPCNPIYEDEYCAAVTDGNPQAPLHLLIFPKIKTGLETISKANESQTFILGHLLFVAKTLANIAGCEQSGFRLVINDGIQGGQTYQII